MGIVSGPFAFGVVVPLFNCAIAAIVSTAVTNEVANRFMFAILAASASYIAVPAAMKKPTQGFIYLLRWALHFVSISP